MGDFNPGKPESLWKKESNSYNVAPHELKMYRQLNSQQSGYKLRDPFAYNVISGSYEAQNHL
jgi:hypothetical protein